eukprot:TRINITY_DN16653_c0_g1_i1.p1 TRINITY_DN16653_c0_g1~~TRINITY_DN16653_c0_g1_i1.p1  ORF type:complete len:125 (+),score=43.49 TRINITY_DN16653_c0_g1_i1:66-440(+)
MDAFDTHAPRLVNNGRRAGKARLNSEAYAPQSDLVVGFDKVAPQAVPQAAARTAVLEMGAGEATDSSPRMVQRCKGGCGFYASPDRHGYCSTCFIPGDAAEEDIVPAPAAAAPVHGRRAAGRVC